MNPADSQIVRNCSSTASWILVDEHANCFQRLPLSSFASVPRNQLLKDSTVSITDHDLLKWICPLPWMSDQVSFQPTHHTNSIRLRGYRADLPSDLCCEMNRISSSFSPKDSSVERTCTSEYRLTTPFFFISRTEK